MDQAFSEKISAFVSENERRARELSIMERVIRVEEELRALREIEATRFKAAERRFESRQREMTARFEAMDKRFVFLQWMIGLGFSLVTVFMGFLKFWP